MSEHTKGPWSTEHAEASNVLDHEGGSICLMKYLRGRHGMGGRRDAAEVEANARLIASAPDLLEALTACQSWIDRWTKDVGNCKGGSACTCGREAVLFDANAAITKATGQESGVMSVIALTPPPPQEAER